MNHSWDMAHSLYSSYVFLAAPTQPQLERVIMS